MPEKTPKPHPSFQEEAEDIAQELQNLQNLKGKYEALTRSTRAGKEEELAGLGAKIEALQEKLSRKLH